MRGATSLLAPEFADWMLGSMSSGVIAIDTDERVVRVNDGARRVLRLTGSVSEISGRPCAEVLSEQPAAARVLVAALSGQRPLSRAELVLDAPMGQPAQTIAFTLTTVRDDRGGMRGVAMIFRDLTPFERSDEQARLQDRLAALGQMAAGLAHEIRNPLAGMEVVAGLLKRRLADLPDECALVDQITAELRSVADTVSDALGYVRPVVSARAPVDLSALVAEAIEVARTRVEFAGKVVREERGRVDPISADPEQLRAVVTNLVVNAFEAMEGDANACLDVTVEESESTRHFAPSCSPWATTARASPTTSARRSSTRSSRRSRPVRAWGSRARRKSSRVTAERSSSTAGLERARYFEFDCRPKIRTPSRVSKRDRVG